MGFDPNGYNNYYRAGDFLMKVAIYCRVSREDLNLDNQILPLVAFCKREGWEYEVFSEKESTRNRRPIQNKLYNDLLKRKYSAVLVYKFDRWARSSSELITHLEEFQARGIQFISYSENIDPSTPYGKAFFGFISIMAELERGLIRERTLAGLDRARAWGKKLGRPKKNESM